MSLMASITSSLVCWSQDASIGAVPIVQVSKE
jgi:hypothetical protein